MIRLNARHESAFAQVGPVALTRAVHDVDAQDASKLLTAVKTDLVANEVKQASRRRPIRP